MYFAAYRDASNAEVAASCFTRALIQGHPQAPSALALLRRVQILDAGKRTDLHQPPVQPEALVDDRIGNIASLVTHNVFHNRNLSPFDTRDTVSTALHTVAACQQGGAEINFQSRMALAYRNHREFRVYVLRIQRIAC